MVFTPPIVNVELRSKDEDEAGYSMALPGGCKFTQRRRRYLKGPSILIGDTACASVSPHATLWGFADIVNSKFGLQVIRPKRSILLMIERMPISSSKVM